LLEKQSSVVSRKHDNYPGVARQFCVPTGTPVSWLIGQESKDGGVMVDWSIDSSNN
jgi:hypothetical protein